MVEASILKDSYMFNRLSDERLVELYSSLEIIHLDTDEVLFNMGDPGQELYIVDSGRIAIYAPNKEHPGTEQPIRIFRTGGVLGEMALIDYQPRSLSARAIEPTAVLALSGETFRDLIRSDPETAFSVMYGLSDRIRYTTQFLNEVREWVGRVTQGDYGSSGFLDEVRGWVRQVSVGEYEEEQFESDGNKDQTLTALAAEFAQMAAQVKKRENELKREIAQLKIEIDESKRKQEVSEIVNTDYFQSIRDQVQNMRAQQDGGEES